MKKIATSYKGKHFVIEDKDSVGEFYSVDPYVDVERVIADDSLLFSHVQDCRYYGIPAYLGTDKELKARIEKMNEELEHIETLDPTPKETT